jgi:hypothetical protein
MKNVRHRARWQNDLTAAAERVAPGEAARAQKAGRVPTGYNSFAGQPGTLYRIKRMRPDGSGMRTMQEMLEYARTMPWYPRTVYAGYDVRYWLFFEEAKS